jgi:hypothetical protein
MENVNVLSDSGDAQRPFKIFLSMQDKWEIGSVLAERLAIPALSAIKSAITSSGGSSEQDVRPQLLAPPRSLTRCRCLGLLRPCTRLSNRS